MSTDAREWNITRFLAIAVLALAAAGCGGGDDGNDGQDALIGTRTVAPEALFPEITKARVSSPMKVEFQVTDERGLPVAGIDSGVSFTVNKLVPGSDGGNSQWQSYILGADEGTPDAAPTTYGDGTLEDNGDGTYEFTFADELEDISGVEFQSGLTHRVGMELRDVELLGETLDGSANGVYDFKPSGGSPEPRDLAMNANCATCHGGPPPFNFHGGPRNDMEYCVTCHQPGAIDVGTGNSIDMADMIHKIHNGSPNAQYCGFGCENFGAPVDDFSEVIHPQDVRNCTTCHNPDDPDTPAADRVNNGATAVVCASCHEDLAFDADGLTNGNGNHAPGPADNSECATCHAEGGLVGSILDSHIIPEKVAAQRIQYNILDIAQTGQGQSPLVTFSVTDPTNDDAPYDITSDDEFTGGGASLNMDIAWPNRDYTNVDDGGVGTGGQVSRPFQVDLLQGVGTKITDNGDGTYTVDTSVDTSGGAGEVALTIPSGETGSGTIAIEGHPAGDFDDPATDANEQDGTFDQQVPATSVSAFFAITDSSPQARREIVDLAKCQNCHGENDGLALHGNNRSDDIVTCAVCHNAAQTDRSRRVNNGGMFDDSLAEQTVDMKYMIHAIHGAEVREGGDYIVCGFGCGNFGAPPDDYSDVAYPQSSANCKACHVEGSYELPMDDDVLGISVLTGGNQDVTDDEKFSREGGTCSSCHNSDDAIAHMEGDTPVGFGNAMVGDGTEPPTSADLDTQAGLDGLTENCAFCHGQGAISDVAAAHGID